MPTEILGGKKKEVERIKEVKMGDKKRAKNPKWKEKRGEKKRGSSVHLSILCLPLPAPIFDFFHRDLF